MACFVSILPPSAIDAKCEKRPGSRFELVNQLFEVTKLVYPILTLYILKWLCCQRLFRSCLNMHRYLNMMQSQITDDRVVLYQQSMSSETHRIQTAVKDYTSATSPSSLSLMLLISCVIDSYRFAKWLASLSGRDHEGNLTRLSDDIICSVISHFALSPSRIWQFRKHPISHLLLKP